MRRSKIDKIESNLVLSIQYARLKEEVRDAKKANDEIADKASANSNLVNKITAHADAKKAVRNEEYMQRVTTAIQRIEANYPQKAYNLYGTEKFENSLALLSKCENYVMIKYQIAIKTVLDNTCEYVNTEDFLANLSHLLFADSGVIRKLDGDYLDITKRLTGKNISSPNWKVIIPIATTTAGVVLSLALSRVKSPMVKQIGVGVAGIAKKLIAKKETPEIASSETNSVGDSKAVATVASAVTSLYGIAIAAISAPKVPARRLRKLKYIGTDDFTFALTSAALCILHASKIMSQTDFQKYYSSTMELINKLRSRIASQLFIEWYDRKENYERMCLLERFDSFVYDMIKDR